jgi:Flp pilus assembly pilin Flp
MQFKARSQAGQGLVEYVLILVFIVLVSIAGLNLLGADVATGYWQIATAFGGLVDDFGRDLSRWSAATGSIMWNGLKQAAGSWKIKDGRMIGDPWALNLFNNYTGSDLSIDLKGAKLDTQGTDWNGYGTLFRGTRNSNGTYNGYGFEFEEHPKGTVKMYFSRFDNGYQTQLGTPTTVPTGLTLKDAQNVTVTAQGNTFTATWNGKPLVSATDKTYKSGQVGVYTNVGSAASFDSFAIR